jgi:hypothetical protein
LGEGSGKMSENGVDLVKYEQVERQKVAISK